MNLVAVAPFGLLLKRKWVRPGRNRGIMILGKDRLSLLKRERRGRSRAFPDRRSVFALERKVREDLQ
jgi:hypothetical protein